MPPVAATSSSFLPTPSARRATRQEPLEGVRVNDFYPRPPRGGRPMGGKTAPPDGDFYPRPPRGGRHRIGRNMLQALIFLPTPSARRATSRVGLVVLAP